MTDDALRLRLAEHVAHGQRRQLGTPYSPSDTPSDWRIGLQVDDRPRTDSSSLASMSAWDALYAPVVVLDNAGQGVPRTPAWIQRAIEINEEGGIQERTEAEQRESELHQERELRAQRQRLADQALNTYLRLRQREYLSPASRVIEAMGHRFKVADDQPVLPMAGMVFGEQDSRPGKSEVARAYYAWVDARDAIVAGPEDDRRMIRLADGSEKLLESWLLERLGWLRQQVGVRESRLGMLREQLQRHASAPLAVDEEPVTLVNEFGEKMQIARAKLLKPTAVKIVQVLGT